MASHKTKEAKRILIVDDDPGIQRLFENVLTAQGYITLQAFEGEEATEKLIREPVDLVLLDIDMPGVDGILTRDVVRIYNRELPVIVSSVSSVETQKRKIPNAYDYFDKADGIDALLEKVKNALRHETTWF